MKNENLAVLLNKENSIWTIGTYALHNEAMRQVENEFQNERDRRYTEVNIEKEKALKIKETADLAALSLARESQTYKEQQNDALRDKNLSESGIYATNASVAQAFSALETKLDKILTPINEYISGQTGAKQNSNESWSRIALIIGATAAIVGIVMSFVV